MSIVIIGIYCIAMLLPQLSERLWVRFVLGIGTWIIGMVIIAFIVGE